MRLVGWLLLRRKKQKGNGGVEAGQKGREKDCVYFGISSTDKSVISAGRNGKKGPDAWLTL